MNITGKDRKDCALPRYVPSAFVVSFQAKSRDTTERPYRFSIPFGRSASSSSVQFLRSGRSLIGATHGSINNRGATQDHGNIVQERGNLTQAHFAGSYLNV